MTSLSDLQDQRAALVKARGSGQLEVEFSSGGTRRRVVYRSLAEIQTAIDLIDADIAAINGTRVRTFRFNTSKGL